MVFYSSVITMMHGPANIKLDHFFPLHFHRMQGINVKRLYWLCIPKTAATPTASYLRNCRILTAVFRPGSSVGIATTGWKVRDRSRVRKRYSARPDRPWGPPSVLQNGYRVFPRGKVRPGRAAGHSPPSSAVVMEE